MPRKATKLARQKGHLFEKEREKEKHHRSLVRYNGLKLFSPNDSIVYLIILYYPTKRNQGTPYIAIGEFPYTPAKKTGNPQQELLDREGAMPYRPVWRNSSKAVSGAGGLAFSNRPGNLAGNAAF